MRIREVGDSALLAEFDDLATALAAFSALDALTREELAGELQRVHMDNGATIIFVTHSIDEAVLLADRVVVLSPRPGRVRETRSISLGYPRDPLSPDVAEQVRLLRLSLVA